MSRFCFLTVRDLTTAILAIIYGCMVLIFLYFVVLQIVRIRKQIKSIMTVVETLYFLLVLWVIFDIGQVVINVCLYFWKIHNNRCDLEPT